MVANYILMSVLNAILFTLANKKCWIRRVELINSVRNTVCNSSSLNSLFQKNVLIGRFFMLVTFSLFSNHSYSNATQTSNCVSAHFDEKAYIEYVIDGDTVVLSDNRHIRLIGINTPELSHDNNKSSEAGAEEARNSLVQILDKEKQIQLLFGKERFDRHGRTLAHIFLLDGLNIQAEMLRKGLAMPIHIGPNLSLINCYFEASSIAKEDNRGLWALDRYKTQAVISLSGSEKGFYTISGKVTQVTESRSSIWVNLKNNVALRIHKDDLNYFNKSDLMSLSGAMIEASGWLYKRNNQLRMRIRHKLDIKQLNEI